MNKSTTAEIRERFDADVERFANLETGQTSTIDARLSLELITDAARAIAPEAHDLLDIGCGAGNYTLMMLTKIPQLNCTLVDLSSAMVERAKERINPRTTGRVTTLNVDIRDAQLEHESFDIILAGAVLHHLRDDADWETTFQKLFFLLKPGGCLMVVDLVAESSSTMTDFMRARYAAYLETLGGIEYRQKVLAYIEKEDSPRSVVYQLSLMQSVGFGEVEILHKNTCFAAFAGIKSPRAL